MLELPAVPWPRVLGLIIFPLSRLYPKAARFCLINKCVFVCCWSKARPYTGAWLNSDLSQIPKRQQKFKKNFKNTPKLCILSLVCRSLFVTEKAGKAQKCDDLMEFCPVIEG